MAPVSYYPSKEMSDVKTIHHPVISASRATDIPAFHAEDFMDRLRAGNCLWQNPFNAKQKQIVSFAETRVFVFWSKNPARLMPYLNEISNMGYKFYFQFTLNDYVEEKLEPGLISPLEERIKTFTSLAEKTYKVIWRYDPVILGDTLTIKRHMQKIKNLMHKLDGATDKLVFSFVDMYGSVISNLNKHNSELRAPTREEMKQFALELRELRDRLAPKLKLATCAEDIDFAKMGIEKNSCIDPVLINEICGEEICRPKKQKKPRITEPTLLPPPAPGEIQGKDNGPHVPSSYNEGNAVVYEKDKGQREACGCAPSKDIGSYKLDCSHRCVYCYAHHDKKPDRSVSLGCVF